MSATVSPSKNSVKVSNPKSGDITNKIGLQEMSMQWLNLRRVQNYTGLTDAQLAQTTLGNLVKKIVDVYNAQKQGESESEPLIPRAVGFKHVPRYRSPTPLAKDYQIQVFWRKKSRGSSIATELEKGGAGRMPRGKSVEYLLFLFRQRPIQEIVALTSGQAWMVVRQCIDYKAPIKIAERILDPRRIVKISRLSLIRANIQEEITTPEGGEMCKTANLYKVVDSFKCMVKKDSSVNAMHFFQKDDLKVTIRTGLFRFHNRLALGNYPYLLEHLSLILNNRQTLDQKGAPEIADKGFEFLHFLKSCYALKEKLDKALVVQIFDLHTRGLAQQCGFRHRYLDDYISTSSCKIQLESIKYQELTGTITSVEALLDLIQDHFSGALRSEEALLTFLKEKKFKFYGKQGEIRDDFLIDALEGEVRDTGGEIYFKLRGGWYQIEADYHALLQEDFKGVLRQTLMQKKEIGQLHRPWSGNKHQGKLLEQELRERTNLPNITKTRELIDMMKNTPVFYIVGRQIKERKLIGEILKNPIIAKHQKEIEELLKLRRFPEDQTVQNRFKEDAEVILKELRKERRIVIEKSGERFVVNPFGEALKETSRIPPNKFLDFKAFLKELCESYHTVEDEESYNRSYLHTINNGNRFYGPETGFLVFDQICPLGIEPCDILKYTSDATYLYHVKETLGQNTRDACSQILNAAKEFKSALSLAGNPNYLDLLWEEIQKTKKAWALDVKNQIDSLGKAHFYKLFQQRRLVFVYAFLSNPNRSLSEELEKKTFLSPEDLNLSPGDPLFAELKRRRYLDNMNRPTAKLYASSAKRFEIEDPDLYRALLKHKSISDSTIAKLELLHAAEEVRALGFEFKICEIPRPGQVEETEDEVESLLESMIEGDEEDQEDVEMSPLPPLPFVIPIDNPPLALPDIGNSCYMNAALQIFFNIPEFRPHIQSRSPTRTFLRNLLQGGEPNALKEQLNEFRVHVFANKSDDLLPFPISSQQDAHEFMTYIMGKIGWHPLDHATIVRSRDGEERETQRDSESMLSIPVDGQEEFQVALDNYFQWSSTESSTQSSIDSLEEDLWDETETQEASQGPATAVRLRTLPDHIIVHMKRFSDTGKLNHAITFPEDGCVTLNQGDESQRYEIVGYLNHIGRRANMGHYTADIKNTGSDGRERWIHCDNDRIHLAEPSCPERDAYVVLLKKIENE